jgi:superfamily II DNA/RNA helicase
LSHSQFPSHEDADVFEAIDAIPHRQDSDDAPLGEPSDSENETVSESTKASGFESFHLAQPIMRALEQLKFRTPTPVQQETIPVVQAGRDVLSTAQTGTGKTAAFVLPVMNRKLKGDKKQTLILAPTRELAVQIQQVVLELSQFAKQVKSGVIIGGSGYTHQARLLRSKPTFVIGTPGRLIDQIRLGNLNLEHFGTLVLDEADRLLDMGFEPQIEEIVASLPSDRQTLLFSATLPKEIESLARRYMKDPARVSVGSVSQPVDRIKQHVVPTTEREKPDTLIREIDKVAGSIIVFVKTKQRTESVAKNLANAGHDVARIHGDRSQSQRNEAIRGFRNGQYRILVATDIAARGIDIPHIRHVVNYDLPMALEDYIHRIGRTARAGAEGDAMAFVTPEERFKWARIHKHIYGKWPEDALELAREKGRNRRGKGPARGGQSFDRGAKNDRGPRQEYRGRTARDESKPHRREMPPTTQAKAPQPIAREKADFSTEEHLTKKAVHAKKLEHAVAKTEAPILNRAARRALQFGTAITEHFKKHEREQDAADIREEIAEKRARRAERGERPDARPNKDRSRHEAWDQSEIFARGKKRSFHEEGAPRREFNRDNREGGRPPRRDDDRPMRGPRRDEGREDRSSFGAKPQGSRPSRPFEGREDRSSFGAKPQGSRPSRPFEGRGGHQAPRRKPRY